MSKFNSKIHFKILNLYIAVAANNEIKDLETLYCSKYIIIIRLKLNNKYYIIGSAYISPSDELENIFTNLGEILRELLMKYPLEPFIFGGDFNARIGLANEVDENLLLDFPKITGRRKSLDAEYNKRGRQLVNLMEEAGFMVLNGRTINDSPARFTFTNKNGSSVIDLVWVNTKAIETIVDMEVALLPTLSDHFPVMITLDIRSARAETDINIRWKDHLLEDYKSMLSFSPRVGTLNLDLDRTKKPGRY